MFFFQNHSKMALWIVKVATPLHQAATTYSKCSFCGEWDDSQSNKRYASQRLQSHVFLCSNFCIVCILVVSSCQSDSHVLLWMARDNGTLSAACNLRVGCLHQIMHYNHKLINLLGMLSEICLADSSTLICLKRLVLTSCLSLCLFGVKDLLRATLQQLLLGQSRK